MTVHDGAQFHGTEARNTDLGEKDDIEPADRLLANPEGLPDDALDPVTDHGAARALA